MAALHIAGCGHINFHPVVSSFFFFFISSPNLSGRTLDVYIIVGSRGARAECPIAADAINGCFILHYSLERGPVPNVMVALPNTGGALCSTPQSLADAH